MNNNRDETGDKIRPRAPHRICVNPPSKLVITFCRLNSWIVWRSCVVSSKLDKIYNNQGLTISFSFSNIWWTSLSSHSLVLVSHGLMYFPTCSPHNMTWAHMRDMVSDIERVKYFPDQSWDAWQVRHDPSCYITKHITQLKHHMIMTLKEFRSLPWGVSLVIVIGVTKML